jgi:ABC-type transport system involved in cytochrome bd biosynthesis fused ATPase/permease subunit
MKVPKDQGLVLSIFYSVSVVVILMVWMFLPPIISHEEDEEEAKVKIVKPEEAIQNVDEVLTQAETTLAELEKKQEEKTKAGKAQDSKSEGKK